MEVWPPTLTAARPVGATITIALATDRAGMEKRGFTGAGAPGDEAIAAPSAGIIGGEESEVGSTPAAIDGGDGLRSGARQSTWTRGIPSIVELAAL